MTVPVLRDGDGLLVDSEAAGARRCRGVRGRDVPHGPVATRRGRLRRQAGGRDRHRVVRDPVDPADREAGRAPHGLPAHAELQHPCSQRARSTTSARPGATSTSPSSARSPARRASASSNLLNPQSALQATPEEREAMFQSRWETGRRRLPRQLHGPALQRRSERSSPPSSSAAKIKETVHDPDVAESLAPKDHPFGTKRLCVDIDYFETYNRPNVTLVDLKKTPIVEFTPSRHPHDGGRARGRRHRLRHRLRRDDRHVAEHRHPGSRRRVAARRVGRRPAHLPRDHGGGVPEPVHDHGPGQPVGAQQHGHLDRAARRLARRPVHAHARATRTTASRRTPTRKTRGAPTSSTSRT